MLDNNGKLANTDTNGTISTDPNANGNLAWGIITDADLQALGLDSFMFGASPE